MHSNPESIDEAARLRAMSLQELWELFPISLVAPKPEWAQRYQSMELRLREMLWDVDNVRISHIGSTAIKGIWAKDIVDILVEVGAEQSLDALAERLERKGFIRMSESPSRISLNYGYTLDGFAEEVFHVHLRHCGDNDELYFRDYLNEYPGVAEDYQRLKLSLWREHEHDRDAYTEGKTEFVRKWTEEAKRVYKGRY